MTQLGDAFEVIHILRDEDDRLLQNTWFYRYDQLIVPLNTNYSQVLAERFDESKIRALLAIHSPRYRSVQLRVRNLFDDDDKYVIDHNKVGTLDDNVSSPNLLPSFNAVKWTLTHNKASIRKGRKFLGSVREFDQSSGVLSTALLYVAHVAVATIMLAPVTTSFIFTQDTYVPIVVKRVSDVQQDGSVKYRLPNLLGQFAYGVIQAITPSLLITSMNSRKD